MTVTLPPLPADRTARHVLSAQAVEMAFQPVVELYDGTVKAYEALARFDPHFISPVHAFKAASDAGIGVELELLAIEQALLSLDHIPAGAWLSTNLSVEALMNPTVINTLLAHADRGIGVELTEHTQVHDYEALVQVTNELRAAGVLIAVDDAGAGFASLSHILQLRPDIIKLDITLTRGIDTDPVRGALARSLVSFADDIGAMLIAEGIETFAEHEKLRGLGVRLGQGFYMGSPGPLPTAQIAVPA
ncbi:EAL domain-containing protein (putative c-di-GMP-specific phosphodiesterase class I) [Krasilnikovia cinnamomea]|uniref:EAL domain-containing protein (Putative c-di-GMP-specific phosphodiesterase class I) n=1 Tax=Krasilnikovia cinnamomea TaxID=349313 RepID=A0A4Q7ZT49_9ACTN|nr:EAL domain-containing protein [Krasilnikovia cinnamomea]RZU54398.1 EAL domain-containing protein (putative c-di-GMP-specific phosphodiesterase class I) [Krasilnikovia cinnamomea]